MTTEQLKKEILKAADKLHSGKMYYHRFTAKVLNLFEKHEETLRQSCICDCSSSFMTNIKGEWHCFECRKLVEQTEA
jgi:hypothetical protein